MKGKKIVVLRPLAMTVCQGQDGDIEYSSPLDHHSELGSRVKVEVDVLGLPPPVSLRFLWT